jgi:hypothetical protein
MEKSLDRSFAAASRNLIAIALCVAGLASAGTKTENNIQFVKTANSSAGVNFVLIKSAGTNLASFCTQDWVRVPDNAMYSNILAAMALGKSANMVTIENAAPTSTAYGPIGPISANCRLEWVEFSYP